MKTIIFSDTHLTHRFDEKRYRYLKKIIESADRVIINGDFWDYYFTSFDKFVNSKWSLLFPILRKKQAIYLFGNHDKREYCNNRVSLFSTKNADNICIQNGKYHIHIEHGHRIDPSISERFPWVVNRITVTIGAQIKRIEDRILRKKIFERLKRLERRYRKLKTCAIKNMKNDQFFVFSHRHTPEIDMKNRFIITGSIQFGEASYLIIENGSFSLKKEHY